MIDDDVLIAEVLRLKGDRKRQRILCDGLLASAEPIARKARWAYSHFLARTGQDAGVDMAFVSQYLHAWRDSILYLANGPGNIKTKVPADLRRTVLACWHFPEHTALLKTVAEADVLVVVAREQSWMEDLRKRNALYCFRDGPSLALPRAMASGRPVFVMMDFCYPDTRQLVTNFLSYPSRTPCGILQLAAHYDYTMRLISIRGRTVQCVADFPVRGRPEQDSATDLNRHLEAEILRRPERWLLWPAVDQRWIGVDYGDEG